MRDYYVFIPTCICSRPFAHAPRILESDELKRRPEEDLRLHHRRSLPGAVSAARARQDRARTFPKRFGIELREIDHYVKSGTLDYLLTVLECFARLGLINRYPLLMGYIDWLVNQQEKDGRWNLPTKALGRDERASRLLRLAPTGSRPIRRSADLTFRSCMILKLQWERQIRMLDRGEEAYPF
jgi:hypothetical protein